MKLSNEELDWVRREGGPREIEAAADGVISEAEYDQLALAFIACVEESGATITTGIKDATGVYRIVADVPDAAQAAFGACQRNLAVTPALWKPTRQLAEEVLQEARSLLYLCLDEGGADLPEGAGPREVVSALSTRPPWFGALLKECQRSIETRFQLVGFLG